MRRWWLMGTVSAVLALPAFAAEAPKYVGTWVGTLEAGPQKLTMIFKVTAGEDGALSSTISVPEQGLDDLPFDVTMVEGGTLRMELKVVNGVYEGKLTDDGTSLEGKWTQNGMSFDLDMVHEDQAPKPNRPQEPKEPFPYRIEEVSYANAAAGILFQGTLTIPEGDGPHPAVVLLTGSGPQDRDETLMGHKPFWVIADNLSRRGIAVLRSDDRGVNGTAGSTEESTIEDHAGDALAAVAFLKGRGEIDAQHIGLIGHSEGALVAPVAAAQSDDVAFCVLLAPPGVDGLQVVQSQAGKILGAMGADAGTITRLADVRRRLCQTVMDEEDNDVAMELCRPILEEAFAMDPTLAQADVESRNKLLEGELKKLCNPWMRFFLRFDPAEVLAQTTVPVLAMWGEKDWQVLPDLNLDPVRQALERAGNEDATCEIVPGVNHLFQTAETGSPSEYSQIEETIAQDVLDRFGNWICERCGLPVG